MKCLINLINQLSRTIDTIDLASVCNEVHMFMVYHPNSQWKQASDRAPLNVINKFLSAIILLKQTEVVKYLHMIPVSNTPAPYVALFVTQMLKQTTGREINLVELMNRKESGVEAESQTNKKSPRRTALSPRKDKSPKRARTEATTTQSSAAQTPAPSRNKSMVRIVLVGLTNLLRQDKSSWHS